MSREDPLQSMVQTLHASGMTYREIGQAANLSHATVWKYAIGEAHRPSWSSYQKLVRTYERVTGEPPPG